MATITILFGSILGLLGGITAYIGFDASLTAAVSIWIAAGPAAVIGVMLFAALAPSREAEAQFLAEVA